MQNINNYSLYLITSQEHSAGRSTFEIAQMAIKGGIDILQMREKTLSKNELIELGKKISTLCKNSNIVFIANDDPHLVAQINADGVHLGQEDAKKFSPQMVREIIGPDKIIGLSTHSLKEVKAANKLDINYIAFGPIFKTKTKNYSIGTSDLPKVLELSKVPVICIGGININNIEEVLKLGAKNIAMIRGISEASDIYNKVKELKALINKYKGGIHDYKD